MSDEIGPATDSVLLAVAAIGILVVTAPFLAQATIDVPAASATGPDVDVPASDAENLETEDASHVSDDATEGGTSTSGAGSDGPDVAIDVDASTTGGHLVPGREVVLTVTRDGEPAEGSTVYVAGSPAGTADSDGEVSVTVPPSETFGVEANLQGGVSATRRFSAETDLDVEIVGPISRTDGTAIHASVDGHDVPGATVSRNGQDVNETNEDGVASFDVPAGADELDVTVARGDAAGNTSVDLDLELGLETLVPAAGSRASVSASYGGTPADVDLYVVRGDVGDSAASVVDEREDTLRATDGSAHVSLPPSSSVTVIATDGQQTATATMDGLLRNLGIALVVGLSLVVGVPITSLRVLRWLDVDAADPNSGTTFADLIADLGTAIVAIVLSIARIPEQLPLHRLRIPGPPRLSLPSLPSLELPSLPKLRAPTLRLPSLSLPSLSLPRLRAPKLSLPDLSLSGLSRDGSDDDGTEVATASGGPTDPFAEDTAPQEITMTERELVRAAVRDLGRLSGLRRVETRTPGQIGRTAIDRALPQEPVEAIVGTVRDVEYAGSDPTTEEASRVKRAVRRLRDAVRERGDDA